MTERKWIVDLNVVIQVALISGLIFGLLLLGSRLLVEELFWRSPKIARYLNSALALFCLWLVVTGGVRSVHALRRKSSTWLLWLTGGITALCSVLLASLILGLAANLGLELGDNLPGQDMYLFALGFGLVFSLVALIHLKVRNRALGNTLELLVIVAILALLIYGA